MFCREQTACKQKRSYGAEQKHGVQSCSANRLGTFRNIEQEGSPAPEGSDEDDKGDGALSLRAKDGHFQHELILLNCEGQDRKAIWEMGV